MTTKWKLLQRDTPTPDRAPTQLFLSANDKTGLSINTAIAYTCKPTKACSTYCYGLESRIRMQPALRRQVENYARFELLERAHGDVVLHEVRVVAALVRPHQDFLRFFGVGDLQRGSVRFINSMAANVPELALWVATRRLELARQLDRRSNIFVMMGLDHSSKPAYIAEARQLIKQRRPQFYGAWVQTDGAEEVPAWVKVVFAEHHIQRRAPWTVADAHRLTCPATIQDGAAHHLACKNCRYCFDPKIKL